MHDLKERLKEFLRIKNYSPHTISNYERDINRFLSFLEEKKINPDDLMPATLTQWIIFLRKKGLGNRSIQRNISSLRNFTEPAVTMYAGCPAITFDSVLFPLPLRPMMA